MRFFSQKYIFSYLCKLLCKKQIAASYSLSWEQRKLIDYLEVSSLKNKTGVYGKEDVLSVSGDFGIVNQIEFQGRSFAGASLANYGVVETGDIVYTKSPLKANPYGIIKANKGKAGIVSTLYAAYKPKENTDSTFVQIYFEQDARMNNYMQPLVNKGAKNDMKVSDENALKGRVSFPKKPEQIAISSYFESLDNLITLHQRKWKRINFAVHTDQTITWEQRKFSELYEKVSRKNDLTYGKDDIISVANMYFKEDSYITDESYLLTYNIFELGDIAFEGNKSKNYAHGRFVENTIGNGIVSHVFDVFKPIMKPYDLQFWKYAINNEQLMGGILLRSTKASTMMTNLVANDFLQETFLTPTYPEQQKIGAFFQQLDNLITLHQCEFQIVSKRRKARLRRRAFEFTVIFALIVL